MKIFKKSDIRWIVIFVVFICFLVLTQIHGMLWRRYYFCKKSLDILNAGVERYIKLNHGAFPVEEKDLEKQGFIEKKWNGDEAVYFYLADPNNKDSWERFYEFSLFKIRYGARLENIECIDRKLYDKSTHKQILLVSGPYSWFLKHKYEAISHNWYKLLLQEKEKHIYTTVGDSLEESFIQ